MRVPRIGPRGLRGEAPLVITKGRGRGDFCQGEGDLSSDPGRGGATQAVIDGTAKAGLGNRGEGDLAMRACLGIGFAQGVKQVGRSLDQISGR